MRFFLALVVYLLMGMVLTWGVALLAAKGNIWPLALGLLTYLVMFFWFGCLPKKAH